MNRTALTLPERAAKPRTSGLTMVIDGGLPLGLFTDLIALGAEYIDYVKFGWGTSVVTSCLREKISVLDSHGIGFYFGGTLFEKFVAAGPLRGLPALLRGVRVPARRGVQRHDRDVQRREGRLHP